MARRRSSYVGAQVNAPAYRSGTGAYRQGPATYSPGAPGRQWPQPAAPALPPAPPPGEAPTDAGPPIDPYYEAQKAASQRGLRLGEALDTYQTGLINANFGFNDAGGIDPNNPYSLASQLSRRYQEQQRGNVNSYADRGSLYSGGLTNAQQYASAQFDVGLDQLRKQRQEQLGQILAGKVNRYSSAVGDIDQGQIDALLRALGS